MQKTRLLNQRSLQFGSGIRVVEVVEVAVAISACLETSVRGFAAVDPMGFVDSRSFAAAVAGGPVAGHTLEAPVAEHIPGALVVGTDCRTFAGSEEERVGVAVEEPARERLTHRKGS